MRKWTLRITICLILGVVTTYLVAWGFVVIPGSTPRKDRRFDNPLIEVPSMVDWWRAHAPSDWPSNPQFVVVYKHSRGHLNEDYHVVVDFVPARPSEPRPYAIVRFLAGWPFLALEGRLFAWRDPSIEPDRVFALVYLTDRDNATRSDSLPLQPMIPGFLLNTLFYAAIWFGLFFAMGRTRRFIRTRRGRCPRCGYDLRGEFRDGCSECGWNRAAADSREQTAEGSVP